MFAPVAETVAETPPLYATGVRSVLVAPDAPTAYVTANVSKPDGAMILTRHDVEPHAEVCVVTVFSFVPFAVSSRTPKTSGFPKKLFRSLSGTLALICTATDVVTGVGEGEGLGVGVGPVVGTGVGDADTGVGVTAGDVGAGDAAGEAVGDAPGEGEDVGCEPPPPDEGGGAVVGGAVFGNVPPPPPPQPASASTAQRSPKTMRFTLVSFRASG